MKQPKWSDFFFRVGGVISLFVVAILVAKEFFPEKVGYAVGGTAFVVFFIAALEVFSNIKRTKSSRNRRKKSK